MEDNQLTTYSSHVCHIAQFLYSHFLLECKCNFHKGAICGADGKMYRDICTAQCEGVKKECDGYCPCKGKIWEFRG